ncbi:MAG TPA: FAD-binding oxidoreductase [Fimbriimonadaceae bacterium]|nr:FAD-binding oxidoreductase [Fimbriimonadaceae bacterium]
MTRLPPERIERLSGFGLSVSADGYVYRPSSLDGIRAAFEAAAKAGRQVVLRGAGRSYGDVALGAECVVIELTRLNRVIAWDPETGILEAEGGVTFDQLWRHTLEDGWWPPVVTGTAAPTLAGALAMNVHGKNHWQAGSLAEHVLEIDVLRPDGELVTLRQAPWPECSWWDLVRRAEPEPDPEPPREPEAEPAPALTLDEIYSAWDAPTFTDLEPPTVEVEPLPVLRQAVADSPLSFEVPGEHESAQFRMMIGSAGLLGVIVRVVLRMKRVQSGDLRVLPIAVSNWNEMFQSLQDLADRSDYLVGWVDAFAKGPKAGRGLIHAAWYEHESGERPASLVPEHQAIPSTVMFGMPRVTLWRWARRLTNRLGMRVVNAIKARMSRVGSGKPHSQSLVAFSFLLDSMPDWRLAYGRGGFLQYQCFVPREQAQATFVKLIAMQQEARLESFLAVVKRHRPDPYPLSWALDGYSLALDFKVTDKNRQELAQLCHRMNDIVLEAGGRFYFAKDSTMRPRDASAYLGDVLARFRDAKLEWDPDHRLTSALAQRLHLFDGPAKDVIA